MNTCTPFEFLNMMLRYCCNVELTQAQFWYILDVLCCEETSVVKTTKYLRDITATVAIIGPADIGPGNSRAPLKSASDFLNKTGPTLSRKTYNISLGQAVAIAKFICNNYQYLKDNNTLISYTSYK